MDEQFESPEAQDEDVEGHLLKETIAAAAVTGAIFAGTAQARTVDPGTGIPDPVQIQTTNTTQQHVVHKTKKTHHTRPVDHEFVDPV